MNTKAMHTIQNNGLHRKNIKNDRESNQKTEVKLIEMCEYRCNKFGSEMGEWDACHLFNNKKTVCIMCQVPWGESSNTESPWMSYVNIWFDQSRTAGG